MKKTLAENANHYMYEEEDVEVTIDDNEEEDATDVSATSGDTEEETVASATYEPEEETPFEEFMKSPEAIQKSYGELLKSMSEAIQKSTDGTKLIDKILLESYSYDAEKVKRILENFEKMYDDLYNANYTLSEILTNLTFKLNGDDYAS